MVHGSREATMGYILELITPAGLLNRTENKCYRFVLISISHETFADQCDVTENHDRKDPSWMALTRTVYGIDRAKPALFVEIGDLPRSQPKTVSTLKNNTIVSITEQRLRQIIRMIRMSY